MNQIDINTLSGSFFSKLTLFSGLDKTELNIVTDALIPVHVKKGDSIFNEGDEGKEMFVFFSGALSAFCTQSDGTQRKLFDVKLGDFFGEMSIIAHEPRSATITAMEDTVVIMFREEDFYRIISQHPAAGFKLLRTISVVQNRWLDQMSKSYSDLLRWGETARRRAITDEMTGLYNRHFLEESLKERFNNQSMNLRVMSLLMMDLDKIHGINDRHGTKGGDAIIIAAANTITSCLRPGDIAARLSGDEFAVLLPDADAENAARVAEQIREKIEKCQVEVPASPGAIETVYISTRTSIGIALAPFHAETTEDLVNKSDTALMKAKELGRNRVEVYGTAPDKKRS
jgi:diguanylate cyclase (GGDEF)-like protein